MVKRQREQAKREKKEKKAERKARRKEDGADTPVVATDDVEESTE